MDGNWVHTNFFYAVALENRQEPSVCLCSYEVLREHAADEDAAGEDLLWSGGDVEAELSRHLRRRNDGRQSS